jgi:hypothetical protein
MEDAGLIVAQTVRTMFEGEFGIEPLLPSSLLSPSPDSEPRLSSVPLSVPLSVPSCAKEGKKLNFVQPLQKALLSSLYMWSQEDTTHCGVTGAPVNINHRKESASTTTRAFVCACVQDDQKITVHVTKSNVQTGTHPTYFRDGHVGLLGLACGAVIDGHEEGVIITCGYEVVRRW